MKVEKARIFLIIRYVVLFIVVLISIFPPIWMFLTSFKYGFDAMAYPPKIIFKPTLEHWGNFFLPTSRHEGYQMIRSYLPNSLFIALASTVFTLSISTLAAFSIARFTFPGRKIVTFGILCTRMLAPIAMVIPLFILVNKVGMLDKRITLVVVYTGINIPFAIWMLKGFIDEIPDTLEDAAMVDGCTKFTALVKVTLPLIAPGVAAVGIFTFLLCWNDFQLAFFLVSRYAKTLPLQSLAFLTESGIEWAPMSVYGTIVILPAVLFAYYCQKYITRGLTMGAVKE
jgi:multiple sugar transport system permease protein